MKMKYFIIIGIIILTIVGGYCLVKLLHNKDKPKEDFDITNIKSFYITYTNGYAMNSYTRYKLSLIDNNYIAEIKPYGVDEEELLEIEVNKSIMDRIKEVLNKYEVKKWNGFNKSDKYVLDGDSFSLSISLEDKKTISASGYMMWPNHYKDVVGEINSIFMEIYNKEKGIKIDE